VAVGAAMAAQDTVALDAAVEGRATIGCPRR